MPIKPLSQSLLSPSLLMLAFCFSGIFSNFAFAHSGSHDPESLCPKPLVMAHSGDYAPYQHTDSVGHLIGLDVELARLITVRMGCDLQVVQLPPKRAQKMLSEGKIDLMAAASITPERQQYAHFSPPYRGETSVMFIRQEEATTLTQLNLLRLVKQGTRFTTGLGGWYGEDWEAVKPLLKERQVSLTNSTHGQIRMLIMARADVAIVDRYVGHYHARNLGHSGKISEHPQLLSDDPAHFMISKASVTQEQLQAFNQAVQWLLETRVYQATLEKYLSN